MAAQISLRRMQQSLVGDGVAPPFSRSYNGLSLDSTNGAGNTDEKAKVIGNGEENASITRYCGYKLMFLIFAIKLITIYMIRNLRFNSA